MTKSHNWWLDQVSVTDRPYFV